MTHVADCRLLVAHGARETMIGKIAIVSLLAFLAVPSAAADSYVVGDCDKFGGACASICVEDANSACWDNSTACVGVSYQIPQCADSSVGITTSDSTCIDRPCDIINEFCFRAFHRECVR
jgi:hypothetical protein